MTRNERLTAAIGKKGWALKQFAMRVGVNEKTARSWVNGKRPRLYNQVDAARALSIDKSILWPPTNVDARAISSEILGAWTRRFDCQPEYWWKLISQAKRRIDILCFEMQFLIEDHPDLALVLSEKIRSGCKQRFMVADPNEDAAQIRGNEVPESDQMIGRINNTLEFLLPIIDAGADFRFQFASNYISIFRFDDDMMVITHMYGVPGRESPLHHLHRIGSCGLFDRFAEYFEHVRETISMGNTFWTMLGTVHKFPDRDIRYRVLPDKPASDGHGPENPDNIEDPQPS
jgi:lambda repressor-like predicted transcriptional regulator